MVRSLLVALLGAAFLLSFSSSSAPSFTSAAPLLPTPIPAPNLVSGGFIVVASDTIVDITAFITTLVSTLLRPLGLSITITHTYHDVITGFSFTVNPTVANTVVALLETNPLIQFIMQDAIATITTPFPDGCPQSRNFPFGYIHESVGIRANETVPTGVHRINAANATQVARSPVPLFNSIALLDTGIDFTHPDLPSAVPGVNCISSPWGIGNSSQDDNGHGTSTAGVIIADNNGAGIVGVVPGARLFSVKVADQFGQALISDMICGFDWVHQHNSNVSRYWTGDFAADNANPDASYIQIVSISIGAPGADDGACGFLNRDALHTSICKLVNSGVNVVTSAGNSYSPISTWIPASYTEVITTTAFTDTDGLPGGMGPLDYTCSNDLDDTRASYSNYGVKPIDATHVVAAPGTCIQTTYLQSLGYQYYTSSGTSMAAPHAAGTLAMCYESGACKPLSAKANIARFVNDATAYNLGNPTYGAVVDPAGKLYGPLISATVY